VKMKASAIAALFTFLGCTEAIQIGARSNFTCEPLSTLTENNFNDRGDSSLSWTSTYTYSLANGYSVDLIGWTHTRNYAYGFLTNTANTNPRAIVSGLQPGGSYKFKVY
jgi:hypothetical protein